MAKSAKSSIDKDLVRELAAEGAPVLVVSSDLDELLTQSDRLYVMRGGRVAGEFCRPFDIAAVGSAMTGGG